MAPRSLPGMKPREASTQPEQKVAVAVLEQVDTNVPRGSASDVKGKGKEIPIPTVTVTAPSVAADADDDDDW